MYISTRRKKGDMECRRLRERAIWGLDMGDGRLGPRSRGLLMFSLTVFPGIDRGMDGRNTVVLKSRNVMAPSSLAGVPPFSLTASLPGESGTLLRADPLSLRGLLMSSVARGDQL